MKAIQRLKAYFKSEKRVRILACLGALGILLICLSEFLPKSQKTEPQQTAASQSDTDFCRQTEEKLAETIAEMQGAGRVKVMMTLESSDERIYATDEKSDTKTGGSTTQRSYDAQYVLIDGASGDEGMLLKTNAPQVKGVMIVCDGGDDPTVVNQITNAVCATLGIGANRVSVLKMKTAEE